MKYMDIAPDEVPDPKTAPATVDAVVTDIDAENGIVTLAFPAVDGGEPSELQAPAQAGTWQVGAHVSVPQTGAGLPYPVPPPLSVSPGEADRPVVIVGPPPDLAGTPLAERLASGETSARAAKETADTAVAAAQGARALADNATQRAESAADTANAAFQDATRAQEGANMAQTRAREALQKAEQAASAAAGAAVQAKQAITAANGKNQVTSGLTSPTSAEGRAEGDTHWVLNASGRLVGHYVLRSGSWVSLKVSSEAIASLDVGKLTAGSATIPGAVIDKLWAEIIRAKEIVANKVAANLVIDSPRITGGRLDGVSMHGTTVRARESVTVTDPGNTVFGELKNGQLHLAEQATGGSLAVTPGGLLLRKRGSNVARLDASGVALWNGSRWVPQAVSAPAPVQVVSTGYEARRTVSNTSWQDHSQTGFSLTEQRQIRIDITAIVDVAANRQVLIDAYIQPASGSAHGQVARVLVNPAAKYKGSAAGTILTALPRGEYTLRIRALATGGASTVERVQAIVTIY